MAAVICFVLFVMGVVYLRTKRPVTVTDVVAIAVAAVLPFLNIYVATIAIVSCIIIVAKGYRI